MKMLEIIEKLIGNVQPYGDTNIDKTRYENLDLLGEVVVDLVYLIGGVADYKDDYRSSVKEMGEMAYKDLIIIKEYIETITS